VNHGVLSTSSSVASSPNESPKERGDGSVADDPSNRPKLWIGRAHELGAEIARCRGGCNITGTALTVSTSGSTSNSDSGGGSGSGSGSVGDCGRDGVTVAAEASTTGVSSTLGVGLGLQALTAVAALDQAVDIHGDAKPAILFLSGSSGVAGDTLRYLRMFASLGHLVVCPDDFCGWPCRLRHRQPRRIAPGDPADYWTQNLLYQDEPSAGQLVYESCAKTYTSSSRLSVVYDCTLQVKFAALTRVLVDLPEKMARRGIYLAGNSEGAIVLGMMDDDVLDPNSEVRRVSGSGPAAGALSRFGGTAAAAVARHVSGRGFAAAPTEAPARLLGRINIAYSLEPNYFTYRTLKRGRSESGNVTTEATALAPAAHAAQAHAQAPHAQADSGSPVGAPPPPAGTAPLPVGQMGLGMRPCGMSSVSLASGVTDMSTMEMSDLGSDGEMSDESAPGSVGLAPGSEGPGPGAAGALPWGLFGSRWRRDVPTLCINGSEDQFFGRRGSVSEDVVRRSKLSEVRKGDRPHITGDAGQRMSELGMTAAFVAQMEGGRHAMCPTHDLALRAIVTEFLAAPETCAGIPERWDQDDSKGGIMLWHATVIAGQCSFASMASTEELLLTRAAAVATVAAVAGGSGRRSMDVRKSLDVNPGGQAQSSGFLELTSGLARFVRGKERHSFTDGLVANGLGATGGGGSVSVTPPTPGSPMEASALRSSPPESKPASQRTSLELAVQPLVRLQTSWGHPRPNPSKLLTLHHALPKLDLARGVQGLAGAVSILCMVGETAQGVGADVEDVPGVEAQAEAKQAQAWEASTVGTTEALDADPELQLGASVEEAEREGVREVLGAEEVEVSKVEEAPAADGALSVAPHAAAHHGSTITGISAVTREKAAGTAVRVDAKTEADDGVDVLMFAVSAAVAAPAPTAVAVAPSPAAASCVEQPLPLLSPHSRQQLGNTLIRFSMLKQLASLASRVATSLASKVTVSSAKHLTLRMGVITDRQPPSMPTKAKAARAMAPLPHPEAKAYQPTLEQTPSGRAGTKIGAVEWAQGRPAASAGDAGASQAGSSSFMTEPSDADVAVLRLDRVSLGVGVEVAVGVGNEGEDDPSTDPHPAVHRMSAKVSKLRRLWRKLTKPLRAR
jgi:hypothetical protein